MKSIRIVTTITILFVCLFASIPNGSAATSDVFYNRSIYWSGYNWKIKGPKNLEYPGPNYWSSTSNNVWVDKQGRLHLKITKEKGVWKSAEVVNQTPLGYGTYRFYVESRVDLLDPNVVFGMFTYDFDSKDKEKSNYREIDIEFSRWGEKNSETNTNYTVQPYTIIENNHLFTTSLNGTFTNHSFTWKPSSLHFESINGHNPNPTRPEMYISRWDYTGNDVPNAGKAVVNLNLWLFQGKAPMNRKEVEVIIKKFEFIPYQSNSKLPKK